MRRLVKSKKILRNQNHNELYTTPSLTGGCCIFYTDEQNVDEDLRAIASFAGSWPDRDAAGVASRYMDNDTTMVYDSVALMKNKRLAAHQRTASLLYLF